MTSKERVKAAFAHRQPDKVPMDFGGMGCSTTHVTNVAKLREYYGLEKRPVKVFDIFGMTGAMDEDLKDAIGTDVEMITPFNASFGLRTDRGWKELEYMGIDLLVPAECEIRDDGSGGWLIYPQGDTSAPPSGHMPKGGFYFDNIERQQEFDEDNMNFMDNCEEYTPLSDDYLDYLKKTAEEYKGKRERAVVIDPGGAALGDAAFLAGPMLKYPKGIRNLTDWYMAPLLYPDYVHEVFAYQSDMMIKNWTKIHDILGDIVDVAYVCGTDFGNQKSLMCSLDTFEEIYKPYYQKMNNWIHQTTNWKTLKHSCGAVYDVIPKFIESGFDSVNPVQCSAAGMDPQRLKDSYGSDMVFWGGCVDTQKTLPFGTPEQVREQVLERCEIFSQNGGFICASIHIIQCNVPLENIIAMIDAIHEYNGDR